MPQNLERSVPRQADSIPNVRTDKVGLHSLCRLPTNEPCDAWRIAETRVEDEETSVPVNVFCYANYRLGMP